MKNSLLDAGVYVSLWVACADDAAACENRSLASPRGTIAWPESNRPPRPASGDGPRHHSHEADSGHMWNPPCVDFIAVSSPLLRDIHHQHRINSKPLQMHFMFLGSPRRRRHLSTVPPHRRAFALVLCQRPFRLKTGSYRLLSGTPPWSYSRHRLLRRWE